jgi:hypothetical protein
MPPPDQAPDKAAATPTGDGPPIRKSVSFHDNVEVHTFNKKEGKIYGPAEAEAQQAAAKSDSGGAACCSVQ